MNRINTQSVIKAGGIGAVIGVIIGILAGAARFLESDAIGTIVGLLSCCGWALIPALSGALYGYFTPGKEDISQGAIGGALSGFAASFMFGIFNGIVGAAAGMSGRDISTVITEGALNIVGLCCAAVLVGSLLGAVGGAVWVATQGNKGR